jgi:hypothetical protein
MGLGFSALARADACTYAQPLQRVKIPRGEHGETIGEDEKDRREAEEGGETRREAKPRQIARQIAHKDAGQEAEDGAQGQGADDR